MLPEQKEKTREEIVQGTGWGFLIRGSTEPSKLNSGQIATAGSVSTDTPPAPPPPPPNH